MNLFTNRNRLTDTENKLMETFLVVQWLRLHAPNAGGTGLIPGLGKLRSHKLSGMAKKKKLF